MVPELDHEIVTRYFVVVYGNRAIMLAAQLTLMNITTLIPAAQAGPSALNSILIPTAVIFAIASILRRKSAIGGWLLYFCYWIVAMFLFSLWDILLHPQVFFHPVNQSPAYHLALISAVFPRLIAVLAAMALAFILLNQREWIWVERLRLALLVAAIIGMISLVLDAQFFPKSLLLNGTRWAALVFWTFYFYVSERVRRVFQTNDWERQPQVQLPSDFRSRF
jgi:hypothetical protein